MPSAPPSSRKPVAKSGPPPVRKTSGPKPKGGGKPAARSAFRPASRPSLPRLGPLLSRPQQREVVGALLVAVAVVTLVASMGERGPLVSGWLQALDQLLGWGARLAPWALGALGAWLILDSMDGRADVRWSQPAGGALAGTALLALVHLLIERLTNTSPEALVQAGGGGGWVGYAVASTFTTLLGYAPSVAALMVLSLVGVSFMAGLTLREAIGLAGRATRTGLTGVLSARPKTRRARPQLATLPVPEVEPEPAPAPARFVAPLAKPAPKPAGPTPAQIAAGPPGVPTDWILPKVEEVLEPSVEVHRSADEAHTMGQLIEDTLADFGIPVRVVEINPGPAITQFGLEPGFVERNGQRQRVKVSRILALQNDLSLALAASPIRILAPVPGRPFVGIEIPNAATTLVGLSGVVMGEAFGKIAKQGGLPIALGRDTTGRPVAGDLGAMPHLLIAGATGSGKSVAINVLISSLLLTHTPDTLKLLLVDPKRVELAPFRGLPHLAAPVVVEVERVVGVLQWAVREMDRRYRMFAEEGVRNIAGHNSRVLEKNGRAGTAGSAPSAPTEPHLPYIVIVIDELADLMMVAPEEAEKLITRLAQLARATGIHLVLATQRPSVDVVTGLIKANFPSRIAFAVSSSIDSRVILDAAGAEKLLGRGDMLYLASDSAKMQRLQGCYVSDDEIERITRHWRRFAKLEPGATGPAADTALTLGVPEPLIQKELWDQMVDPQTGTLAEERDELFDEAVEVVRKHHTASTSFLQRKLRVGYSRAGRLMDELEEAGIVSPAQGNAPRDVLIGDDEAVPPDFEAALEASFADGKGGPGSSHGGEFDYADQTGAADWAEDGDDEAEDEATGAAAGDGARRARTIRPWLRK